MNKNNTTSTSQQNINLLLPAQNLSWMDNIGNSLQYGVYFTNAWTPRRLQQNSNIYLCSDGVIKAKATFVSSFKGSIEDIFNKFSDPSSLGLDLFNSSLKDFINLIDNTLQTKGSTSDTIIGAIVFSIYDDNTNIKYSETINLKGTYTTTNY